MRDDAGVDICAESGSGIGASSGIDCDRVNHCGQMFPGKCIILKLEESQTRICRRWIVWNTMTSCRRALWDWTKVWSRLGETEGKLPVQTWPAGVKSSEVGNVGFDYLVWIMFDYGFVGVMDLRESRWDGWGCRMVRGRRNRWFG
jgi:hypothetical protein